MNVFTIAFSKHGFEVTSFSQMCSKSQRLTNFEKFPPTRLFCICYTCNVYSVKKDTKCSSVLLLCLVSFFTERTFLESLEYMKMIMTINDLIWWIVNTFN